MSRGLGARNAVFIDGDEEAPRVLVPIRARCARDLEKITGGELAEEPISCGGQGCVFAAGSERVLKLTIDESEALFAAWLMRTRGGHAHLPRVYGVWAIDCAGEVPAHDFVYGDDAFAAVYAVLREDASDMDSRAVDTIYAAMHEGVNRAVERRHKLPLGARQFFDAVVALRAWEQQRGVRLGSDWISPKQWGYTARGQLVLRDLGFALLPVPADRRAQRWLAERRGSLAP